MITVLIVIPIFWKEILQLPDYWNKAPPQRFVISTDIVHWEKEKSEWSLMPSRRGACLPERDFSHLWQLVTSPYRKTGAKTMRDRTTPWPGLLSIPLALCLNPNLMSGPWKIRHGGRGRGWGRLTDDLVPFPNVATLNNSLFSCFSLLLACLIDLFKMNDGVARAQALIFNNPSNSMIIPYDL